LPGFVKDLRKFPLIINARAEGLMEKPSFRAAIKRRRCLIIADGFYEWRRRPGSAKTPYLIRRTNGEPMGFAGLFETRSDPLGGEVDTACIITISANNLMAQVHDRMPAIITRQEHSQWLDNEGVDPTDAMALVRPAPEDDLELVEIGSAVNKSANDGPQLQAPLAPVVRADAT
jgi:putative SOS response-associated peptidase YedK